jgi:hypothetical protein
MPGSSTSGSRISNMQSVQILGYSLGIPGKLEMTFGMTCTGRKHRRDSINNEAVTVPGGSDLCSQGSGSRSPMAHIGDHDAFLG